MFFLTILKNNRTFKKTLTAFYRATITTKTTKAITTTTQVTDGSQEFFLGCKKNCHLSTTTTTAITKNNIMRLSVEKTITTKLPMAVRCFPLSASGTSSCFFILCEWRAIPHPAGYSRVWKSRQTHFISCYCK